MVLLRLGVEGILQLLELVRLCVDQVIRWLKSSLILRRKRSLVTAADSCLYVGNERFMRHAAGFFDMRSSVQASPRSSGLSRGQARRC